MNLGQLPLFPVSASDHATQVDYLFLALMAVSAGIVLLLTVLILFSVMRYHAGSAADRTPPRINTRKLEVTWTVLPLIIFTGIFAWGTSLFLDREKPGEAPMEVYVIGRQWMWEIRYPDGRHEHNRLHVALGQPVRLIMTSEDVIHSFFVPALRVKQDVVPGRYVTLSFTPNRCGEYPIYCAQYCGTAHAEMVGVLDVLAPVDYASWLSAGVAPDSLAAQGRALFAEKGCAGCHTPGAAVHAPRLEGLFGKQVALADGRFVTADAQYIHDCILLPHRNVPAGYDPIMPSYQGQLRETEVIALVEYVKSLRPPAADMRGPEVRRPDPEMKQKQPPAP